MKDIFALILNSIQSLNHSRFFGGLVMIFMNIGSKYITIELSKTQEQYLRNSLARQILIFSIAWFGTHDIFMSLALTAIFHVLTEYLFNENSKFCVLPYEWTKLRELVDTNGDKQVSEEELNQAIKILEKAKNDHHRGKQKELLHQLNSYQLMSDT